MIGGSVAAMFHGEPRATLDIDIIVDADEAAADRILEAFPANRYYLPPREVLVQELSREAHGSFQVLDKESGLKADVYVAGSDPLQAFGFTNSIRIEVGGHELVLAPPTYVVMIKLSFYALNEQAKHIDDIRGILKISPDKVDREAVAEYAARNDALQAWKRCCEDS